MKSTPVRPMLFAGATLALVASCSSGADRSEPVATTTRLLGYESCDALEADLKDLFIAEMQAEIDRASSWWGPPGTDGPVAAPEAGDGAGDNGQGAPRQEGTDYSGTNNQEDGVDEADFVKTDGYHVYVLNGGALHIFGVPQFGQLTPVSTTSLEGSPSQMLIHREADRAVVFSWIDPYTLPPDHPMRARLGYQEGDQWIWRSGQISKVTVLDISDRSAPTLVRELFLESGYQTARMVEGSVRMSAYSWMYIPGLYDWWNYLYSANGEMDIERAKEQAAARIQALSLDDMVPQIYERRPDGAIQAHGLTDNACRSFARPENSHGRGFTSLLSLDLFGNNLSFDADHVLSNWSTVYASQDYLYIAEPANDWWWFWDNADHPEQLNLHMFDIRTPGETRYLGSGRVEGALNNQFSLDEHEGYLRVAATTDRWARWWVDDTPPQPKNHLYVLGLDKGKLETVGHLGNIAPGESIFAARMMGDKGYLVTFEQVDPLFTLDLSNPRQPRLVGELKIPGFSTYLHPIADDKLLGIGVGGDENGANWRTQVSLFDVADFARPTQMDVEELVVEGDWGWSEALYEHKAFQYWAPKQLLAVPLSSFRTNDGMTWQYVSALRLIHVDPATGLSSYGTIDHSDFYNSDPNTYWNYVDIRRSIFMGEYIYAISDRGITVHPLDDLNTRVAQANLPGYVPSMYYWW